MLTDFGLGLLEYLGEPRAVGMYSARDIDRICYGDVCVLLLQRLRVLQVL